MTPCANALCPENEGTAGFSWTGYARSLAIKCIWRSRRGNVMTLSDWGNLGQVMGALAVVASLIFVGFQIRQNTKSNQATALQLNADYWLNYITKIADPNLSKIYANGASGQGKLDQQQFAQFFLLCRVTFMGCENQHYQYRVGLLDRSTYAGYATTIKEQIAAFPGIRAMWQLVRHSYGKDFAVFMDEQITAYPLHDRQSAYQKWMQLVENQNRDLKTHQS